MDTPSLDELPTNQGPAYVYVEENQMDVCPSFITHFQPSISVQPRKGSRDDPLLDKEHKIAPRTIEREDQGV